jgi:hypothetical protein
MNAKRFYVGQRDLSGCSVLVTDDLSSPVSEMSPLPTRLDLFNHSPTGFEWGYGGSGPSQLALAILADATGDDDYALDHYHDFKRNVVAGLNHGGWCLQIGDVRAWCKLNGWQRQAVHHAE